MCYNLFIKIYREIYFLWYLICVIFFGFKDGVMNNFLYKFVDGFYNSFYVFIYIFWKCLFFI